MLCDLKVARKGQKKMTLMVTTGAEEMGENLEEETSSEEEFLKEDRTWADSQLQVFSIWYSVCGAY
jgi:hypothetical protein